MPEVRGNKALLIALNERWHLETSSFHLSKEEDAMNLEDVWHILRIPIHGELVVYDPTRGKATLH